MRPLQVSGFLDNSMVNGEGLRSVLFLSGCYHDCPGCHNQDMQDPAYGEAIEVQEILARIESNIPLIKGLTISGGEPFLQAKKLLPLLKEVRNLSLDCWVYTGYTYQDLLKDKNSKELLPWINVLVEGPFIEDLLTRDLPYIGSTNQRILKLGNGLIEKELHFN